MKLADGEQELATYTPKRRSRRSWTLTSRRLVCKEPDTEHHFALAYLTTVATTFRHRSGEVMSGLIILLIAATFALFLNWSQAHLGELVTSVTDFATTPQDDPATVERYQSQLQGRADRVAALYPVAWGFTALAAVYGLWLVLAGVWGETTLRVGYLSGEHAISVKGKDSALTEFGEKLAQRLQ